MLTKSELRRVYLEKRRSLGEDAIERLSQALADRFFESFDLSIVKNLHCFIPISKFNEINTALIYRRVWSEFLHIQTVAPRIDPVIGEVESRLFGPDTELVENKWGISEPLIGQRLKPAEIDVVLVPLLCFDKRGHRVGYGKGFYDRFLIKCRPDCLKIGLSYFGPVDEITDIHSHDARLNACVTPDKLFDNSFSLPDR